MGAAAARRRRPASWSPTTTRAPRTRRRSGPRCWPARRGAPAGGEVRRDRRPAGGDRRGGRRGPRRATPSWSPGKGHEHGPGDRRRGAPVRRPGRCCADGAAARRADRERRAGDPDDPGRDRRRRSAARLARRPTRRSAVTGAGRVRLPRGPARAGCSSRCAGERVDGHDFAAAAVAAGAVGGARPPGRSARPRCVVAGRRSAALGRAGPARSLDRLPRADRRRGHRLVRQDLDEGPARRAAGPARRRRSRRPGRSTTSSACPLHRAAGRRRTPGTWCWRCPPAGPGTSPPWPGSRRRGSAWCSTSARRTSASSARREAIAAAKGELVEALPAGRRRGAQRRRPAGRGDGRRAPRPGWSRRPVGRTPTCGPRTSRLDERGRARFTLVTAGRVGAGRAAACSAQHQVGNALAAAAVGRWRSGMPLGRGGRRRSAAAAAPSPVADGGHRPAGRRHRHQRRLQRQPGARWRAALQALAAIGPRAGGTVGGARRDGRARRRTRPPRTTEVGRLAVRARRRPAGRGRRAGAGADPRRRAGGACGLGRRVRAGRPTGRGRRAAARASCGPGDVVLVKALAGPPGLDRVADALASEAGRRGAGGGSREGGPRRGGRRARGLDPVARRT